MKATVFWDSQGVMYINYHFGPTRCRFAEKTERKSALSPWQRTGLHLHRCQTRNGRNRLRTGTESTGFTRFRMCYIFFYTKLEKVNRRPEIRVEWRSYRRHGDSRYHVKLIGSWTTWNIGDEKTIGGICVSERSRSVGRKGDFCFSFVA